MTSQPENSRVGTMFGPYEIRSLIGAGGMGEVYRAYDTVKDRTVAVKLLRPVFAADRGFQDRFRRESRLAAQLQEPHVIPVHDWGEIDGVLYIEMRLVEGRSVGAVLSADRWKSRPTTRSAFPSWRPNGRKGMAGGPLLAR